MRKRCILYTADTMCVLLLTHKVWLAGFDGFDGFDVSLGYMDDE